MKSAAPKTVSNSVGARLIAVRAGKSQPERADELGVHKNTYARWERDEVPVASEALAVMIAEGWNANWVLTGQGPERLESLNAQGAGVGEPRAEYTSQLLSDEDLTIALELADKVLEDRWLPRPNYARVVGLMLESMREGHSYEEILAAGREALRELFTGGSSASKSVMETPPARGGHAPGGRSTASRKRRAG